MTVVAHQYRAGSSEEQTELIELWDIGGSTVHRKASVVFLEGKDAFLSTSRRQKKDWLIALFELVMLLNLVSLPVFVTR